jgi:predicted PurR-regulated permease PerM
MRDTARHTNRDDLGQRVTDLTIRLLIVLGLVYWCFLLLRPFLLPIAWGLVLAVALHPVFERLASSLGGRRKMAGAVFILVGLGIVGAPTLLVAESFLEGLGQLSEEVRRDTISVPPPPEGVAEWPLIGEPVHEAWANASENLESTLHRFGPQVAAFGRWLLGTVAGFGVALVVTIVSIIIAGVMLVHAEGGGARLRAIGARIGGEDGAKAIDLAARATRSVAYGVVGVAAAQSALAAIGLVLIGVPAAGLWAGLVLILAVAQLPPLLVLGPAIVYVAATPHSTVGLVLFAVWSLLVSFSDALLKPLLLGRGMDIPMPVILIGAIGGMIWGGVLGLFVGAVVLAVGYRLYLAWMAQGPPSPGAIG